MRKITTKFHNSAHSGLLMQVNFDIVSKKSVFVLKRISKLTKTIEIILRIFNEMSIFVGFKGCVFLKL
jgi:hypothetical protein